MKAMYIIYYNVMLAHIDISVIPVMQFQSVAIKIFKMGENFSSVFFSTEIKL